LVKIGQTKGALYIRLDQSVAYGQHFSLDTVSCCLRRRWKWENLF